MTVPSLNGVPCLSPMRLSGAITSLAKRAGLGQHRIDGFFVEVAVKPLGKRGFQAGGVLERKGDIGNRRAVGHGAQSSVGPQWVNARSRYAMYIKDAGH